MNPTVTQLENQQQKYLEMIKRRDQALKLSQNKEFKQLILDYFCVQECARYAQVSGDPSIPVDDRANSLAMAQAAGHLRRFLSVTVMTGNRAEAELPELREAIEIAQTDPEADDSAHEEEA